MRIWLIEDDDLCRATLVDIIIEVTDACVESFSTCADAVRSLTNPDIIIVDAATLESRTLRYFADKYTAARLIVYSAALVWPFTEGRAKQFRDEGVDCEVVDILGRNSYSKLRNLLNRPRTRRKI